MSEALKQWMYNIIIFILFSSLIQHLAAEKKYEKYIKFFSGLLLVMVVISPVFNWFGSDKILEFNYLEENFSQAVAYASEEVESIKAVQEETISKKYRATIQSSLETILKNNGYLLVEADIELESDSQAENYYYPKQIHARIEKNSQDEGLVEQIKINTTNIVSESKDTDNLTDETKEIKNQICGFFGIKEEAVTIEII